MKIKKFEKWIPYLFINITDKKNTMTIFIQSFKEKNIPQRK